MSFIRNVLGTANPKTVSFSLCFQMEDIFFSGYPTGAHHKCLLQTKEITCMEVEMEKASLSINFEL